MKTPLTLAAALVALIVTCPVRAGEAAPPAMPAQAVAKTQDKAMMQEKRQAWQQMSSTERQQRMHSMREKMRAMRNKQ